MTTLNPIEVGINKYCGPAVLSAISGRSPDECAAIISSFNGRKEIKGVYLTDMVKAFNHFGFECQPIKLRVSSLFSTISLLEDGKYLVMVPGHYVAIERDGPAAYFIDNHTKKPMNAAASARLNQPVKFILKIVKKENSK